MNHEKERKKEKEALDDSTWKFCYFGEKEREREREWCREKRRKSESEREVEVYPRM